jgi:hypothetical protein
MNQTKKELRISFPQTNIGGLNFLVGLEKTKSCCRFEDRNWLNCVHLHLETCDSDLRAQGEVEKGERYFFSLNVEK